MPYWIILGDSKYHIFKQIGRPHFFKSFITFDVVGKFKIRLFYALRVRLISIGVEWRLSLSNIERLIQVTRLNSNYILN